MIIKADAAQIISVPRCIIRLLIHMQNVTNLGMPVYQGFNVEMANTLFGSKSRQTSSVGWRLYKEMTQFLVIRGRAPYMVYMVKLEK